MEIGSKSKRHFKLKGSKPNQNALHAWFDNNEGQSINVDEDDFGTFHNANAVKTPVRPLRANNTSPINQNLSPQFRIGWNDGSQKSISEMESPVSAVSARRKIRRCPENLIFKISPPVIDSEETKSDENSCDILQCINWAKSLIESSNFQCHDEEIEIHDKSVTEITECIKDTSLDIALDDSSNELMIMCSQAVEESVSSGKLLLENKKSKSEKHQITPNQDRNRSKRFKPQYNSNDTLERNISSFDRRLNSCGQKLNNTSSANNLTKKMDLQSENNADMFKKPSQTCVNNNSANLRNLNKDSTNSKILDGSCKPVKENRAMFVHATADTSLPNKSLSALSDNDISSHLNDEDDVFFSLDFNFIDSLQTKPVVPLKSSTNVKRPQMKNYESIKLDTKPLVTKYSKQDIEKRRLEAKKRLLFNKKHRSM